MKTSFSIMLLAIMTFSFVTGVSSGKVPRLFEGDTVPSNARVAQTEGLAATELLPSEVHLIRQLSVGFGVDYRLVFALIRQESQFDRYARSERGAVGLMQIMPVTNSELNEKLHIEEESTLESHLSAGIYYFSQLFDLFPNAGQEDRVKLALAAYNAGPSRIYDAQKIVAYLNGDPNSWNSIKNALPLLSKRYYSLHQAVWEDGKPENGFFGSSRQTVGFVENVMKFFDEYRGQSAQ